MVDLLQFDIFVPRKFNILGQTIKSCSGCIPKNHLQIPAFRLFFLNRNEQSLEVSFTETFTAFALQNFKENRRAVFDGFGENL